MPVRMRCVVALVLGVLAVLGALAGLIAGPAAVAGTESRGASAFGSSAGLVRTAAHYPATGEFGGPIGQSHPANSPVPGEGATRSRSDQPLRTSRSLNGSTASHSLNAAVAATVVRSLRGHALAGTSRAANHSRHTLPGAANVPVALVVAALALAALAAAQGDGRANRRTSMVLRGRAPPAPAFA